MDAPNSCDWLDIPVLLGRYYAWDRDLPDITTSRCPGIVDSTEEGGLRDQQEGSYAKYNEMDAEDGCHRTPITPPVLEEGRRKHFWSDDRMVHTSIRKEGCTYKVEHANNEEGEDVIHSTSDPDTPA